MNVGVDIGNSGIRIAAIQVSPPAVTPLARIAWCRLAPEQAASRPVTESARLAVYRPDDPAWTDALPVDWSTHRMRWWISSVRRDATKVLLDRIATVAGHEAMLIRCTDLPLVVDVLEPDGVGVDRLLAAWAAADCAPAGPVIVVEAGSAVTVDLVQTDEDGSVRFAGGAILPGMSMMLRQLGQFADLLPVLDADVVGADIELPGRSTEQAMLAGAACGLLGGVRMVVERYRRRYGASTPVITSGGDGGAIAKSLVGPVEHWPDLVMQGIRKLVALRQRA